jgi:hypothetical protein
MLHVQRPAQRPGAQVNPHGQAPARIGIETRRAHECQLAIDRREQRELAIGTGAERVLDRPVEHLMEAQVR